LKSTEDPRETHALVRSLIFSYKSSNTKLIKENTLEKPKVVRIITRLNIGGPSIHAKLLHEGLKDKGFIPYLIHGKVSKEEGDMIYIFTDKNENILYVPRLLRKISPINDIVAFFKILFLLLRLKPKIVHTHMSKAGTLGRFAAIFLNIFGLNIKIVHTYHGHVFEGYFEGFKTRIILLIEKLLGKMSDALIALTEGQKNEICQKYHIGPCEKFHIIPLGFDLTPFLSQRRATRKNGNIKIAIVGRLVAIKNHELFFNASRILLDRREDVEFWVVGDGERRRELEAFVKSLNIDQKVKFRGWIKKMQQVYKELDLLVLCSLNEGTPVTIIEAMASGVPVISTDVGGIREILGQRIKSVKEDSVFHCERGILCTTNDPKDLASAMEYVLSMNIKEIDAMTTKAREFAVSTFSKERLIADMERLYRILIEA